MGWGLRSSNREGTTERMLVDDPELTGLDDVDAERGKNDQENRNLEIASKLPVVFYRLLKSFSSIYRCYHQ